MKYVDRLLQDTEYLELVYKLEQAETARIFCRHGLSHFLDVARIAWIMVLEQEIPGNENSGKQRSGESERETFGNGSSEKSGNSGSRRETFGNWDSAKSENNDRKTFGDWVLVKSENNDRETFTNKGADRKWKENKTAETLKEYSGNLKALREKIYLTALLHDLGRLEEIELGTPHQEAGVRLAGKLLTGIGYPKEEQQDILTAILGHRGEKRENPMSDISEYCGEDRKNPMSGIPEYSGEEKLNLNFINIIKEADNRSRNCFYCEAQAACKWRMERRNKTILL